MLKRSMVLALSTSLLMLGSSILNGTGLIGSDNLSVASASSLSRNSVSVSSTSTGTGGGVVVSGVQNGAPDSGNSAHSTAAVYINGNTRSSSNEYSGNNVTIKNAKNIGKTSASNFVFTSNNYDATGFVITGKSTYTIGGKSKKYKVYSNKSKSYVGTSLKKYKGSSLLGTFNSVLLFGLNSEVASTATIGSSAFDIDSGSTLKVDHTYMQVDGSRRYVASNYNDGTLIVNDSYFVSTGKADGYTGNVSVPFSNEALLISGSARTNFSVGASKTYYFNSNIIAEGWAALSTDSATGNGLDLYAYNSKASTLNGGYTAYADTNCRVSLFGCKMASAEIGAIIAKTGKITIADGSSADSSITKYNTGKATKTGTKVTAGRNAVMLHTPDMMGQGSSASSCGTLNVNNSTLSTSKSLKSTYDYSKYSKAVKKYVDYVSGDDILVKSTSANITLNKAKLSSYNGVLVHTVLNSDSMGNFLKAGDNTKVKPVSVSMTDMKVSGDILHDDYQRDMEITLKDTTLTGNIVQGTFDSWKALWNSYSITSANWLPNKSWSGTNNLTVTLKGSSKWIVSSSSSLSSLTVGSDASLTAPSGKKLTMTVDGKTTEVKAGTYSGKIQLTVK